MVVLADALFACAAIACPAGKRLFSVACESLREHSLLSARGDVQTAMHLGAATQQAYVIVSGKCRLVSQRCAISSSMHRCVGPKHSKRKIVLLKHVKRMNLMDLGSCHTTTHIRDVVSSQQQLLPGCVAGRFLRHPMRTESV